MRNESDKQPVAKLVRRFLERNILSTKTAGRIYAIQ